METIDDLVRQNKIQIGLILKNKNKIYLDLNYWIRMRECNLGMPKDSEYQTLYEKLSDLVNKGKVVCPISQRIFIELLKQDYYDSRIKTARIIDKLSQGVTILSEPEREQSELFYYVRIKLLEQNNIIPVDEYIWFKVAYVLGIFIPENKKMPNDTLEKMQKDIFSKSFDITLEEMIANIGNKIPKAILNRDKSTFAMNLGKMMANNKIHSMKQLFLDELRGGLSVYKDNVVDFFNYMQRSNLSLLLELYNRNIKSPNDMLEVIFNDIKNDTINGFLPSLYIQLCLHTLMRWDKVREFKSTDLEDFLHASSALPYYDYFFTEKPLTHLLKSGPFDLDKKYKKVVLSEVSEVIKSLVQIENKV